MLTNIVAEAFNFPVPLVTLGERLHISNCSRADAGIQGFWRAFHGARDGIFRPGIGEGTHRHCSDVRRHWQCGGARVFGSCGDPRRHPLSCRRVSSAQEKQLTTLGQNITALEVSGSFDDCQRLAKQALVDPQLAVKLSITSANSINIGG